MRKEFFDPYLWDRSGDPDEQLRRLEKLLERYRHEGSCPATADDPPDDVTDEEAPI